MKLKAVPALLIGALFMVIYSCSSMKVVSSYDKEVDFSQYKTIEYLGWSEGSEELVDQVDKDLIVEAVGAELRSRSFERVDEGADLVVSLFLVLNVETVESDYTDHYKGYYGIGNFGAASSTPFEEYDYTVGTLIIDVFDAKTKLPVWQGIGTKTVDDNLESRENSIPKAIAKIMAEFPVKP